MMAATRTPPHSIVNSNYKQSHAVHRSDKYFVKLLLQNKARINIFNNYARTCLYMAEAADNYLIIKKKFTKALETDIKLLDGRKESALIIAIKCQHLRAV